MFETLPHFRLQLDKEKSGSIFNNGRLFRPIESEKVLQSMYAQRKSEGK